MLEKKETLQKLMSLMRRVPQDIKNIQQTLAQWDITIEVKQRLGGGYGVIISDPIPDFPTYFRGILVRAFHEDYQQAILVAILSYYFQLTADGEEEKKKENEL